MTEKYVRRQTVTPKVKKEEDKEVNLSPENVVSTPPGQITMSDLLKAQKQIDENNRKAGITKEPLTRPRSKQTLPLANK